MGGAEFEDRKKVDWKALGLPPAGPEAQGDTEGPPLTGDPAEDLFRMMLEEDSWMALGLPGRRPEFRDEGQDGVAPPSEEDRKLLRAYVADKELPKEVSDRLFFLTVTYKSWNDEAARLLVEYMKSLPDDSAGPPSPGAQ